jgi:predicted ester cyclase
VVKTLVRTLSLLLLLAMLLSACQPIQALPATQAPGAAAAATSLEQANQAVIQRLYEEVMNQKDLRVVDEIFDAHVVAHDTGDEGVEGAKAGLAALLAGLPDLKVTVDFWVVKGDMVTSQVSFRGTQRGELMGVAPTGKPVAWTHIDIHRVQNGKITDVWHTIPVADILHQIQGEPTGETDTEAANQAVVQRWYEEVFNQKNPRVIGEIFAENAVIHDLDYGADGAGPDLPFVAFPDLQTTVNLWIVKDDYVTAVVTLTGTQQGKFLGIAPTGKPVTFSLIDIWRVQDGKVTELWHNVPISDILEQLGYQLVPPAP